MRSPSAAHVVALMWLLLTTALASRAHAQTDGWLSVGAGLVTRVSTKDGVGTDYAPVPVVRVGRSNRGWGVRFGFNWFTTDVERVVSGRPRPFGRLRIRPLLLGYGYGTRYKRARVSVNLKGGYAFASFALQPTFTDAYGSTLNTGGVRADADSTFVLKPDVVAWIDVSRKIGLNIGAGYIVARPHVALTSAAGIDRRRVNADILMIQIGAVYSIF